MIYKCQKCNKEFKARPYEKRKYCSLLCADRIKKVVYEKCKKCGKEFLKTKDRKYFCSKECANNMKIRETHKLKIICRNCQKEFFVIPSASFRKYCCHKCAIQSIIKPKQYWKTKIVKHSANLKHKYFNLRTRALRLNKYYPKKDDFVNWYLKQEKKCSYCDIPQETWEILFKGHQSKYSLTIDRKNNNWGYEIDNLALACSKCNVSKNDLFTCEEMREIAQKYIKPKWQIKLKEGELQWEAQKPVYNKVP